MPQWKPEDEALFAELCRRAEQQSREAALRAAPAPPPPPPKGAAGLPPRRLRRRAAARRAGFLPKPRPLRPAAPPLDQETLLILVVLAFLLRCRADRELIWALLYILLF
ncbi:MAG: hypothetical protein ACLUNX_09305 [Angelakisella sp.]